MKTFEEFIEKNESELYNICEKSALMIYPLKEQLGYHQSDDFKEEANWLYNKLLLPTLEYIYKHEDCEEWLCASGWYCVRIYRIDNTFDISIVFEIDTIVLEI